MKLLWNSLLISLGILLPNATVLAESLKTVESTSRTATTAEILPESSSVVTVADETPLTPDVEIKATPETTLISEEHVTSATGQTARTGLRPATLTCRFAASAPCYANANIPQPLLPSWAEGEQLFKVPLPNLGEGFRVRVDKGDMLTISVEPVVVEEVSPAETPEVIVIPDTTQESRPTVTSEDTSSESAEPIVIPDAVPTSTPTTEETETPENTETTTTPSSEDSADETEATDETDASETEETTTEPNAENSTEAKEPELSPEELARQQKLIEADRLYMSGQFEAAQQLYREAKDPFAFVANLETQEQPEPIYDPAQLPPAGSVYWRQSQTGSEQKLETKILVPLQLLVEQYPQFIPGHLRYAEALEEYERQEETLQVLERATTLYPDEPELLKATLTELGEAEQWLEASLMARQFSLLNANHPQAEEFGTLADENLERYKSHLRRKLRGNAIANVITGALGFVLTGNLFGPISAIDTTILMLRGESAVGKSVANRAKKHLPMLEDEEVLEYVREIGNKLAIVAGRDDFEYEFHVVMDDQLNAFALPGGKVFINAGAILKTKSEAELAGLLAHELAHAVLSHGFQLVTEGNLIANVTQYFPFGGTAANLIVLDYNRDMERQADALGTRILISAGYAADGLHNLMMTLDKEERDRPIFAWLSTHPDTEERITNIETLIERNAYNRYTYEGVARHLAIQERVAKLLKEYKECEENEEREECEKPEESEESEERQEQEE